MHICSQSPVYTKATTNLFYGYSIKIESYNMWSFASTIKFWRFMHVAHLYFSGIKQPNPKTIVSSFTRRLKKKKSCQKYWLLYILHYCQHLSKIQIWSLSPLLKSLQCLPSTYKAKSNFLGREYTMGDAILSHLVSCCFFLEHCQLSVLRHIWFPYALSYHLYDFAPTNFAILN